ncbi:MAG: hypothetical protein ACRD3J_25070 [Thermoanaerobaculia bacterium]
MCARDGGRMWGVNVCGPTMVVDRQTRAVAANQPAPATLPKEIGIANTAVDWDGVYWTMIAGPLPDDPFARKMLLAHESFHRIQKGIGFPQAEAANAHLDSVDGRYWLQLEWRALAFCSACRRLRREPAGLAGVSRRNPPSTIRRETSCSGALRRQG